MARFPEPGVTVTEAVALLERLEPRAAADLTERKFRYAAAMLGLASGRMGATKLYTLADLALVRLLVRLEASGLSRPVARFAAVYIAPEVRDLLERGRPIAAIVVVPVAAAYPKVRRAVLTTEGEARRLRLGGVYVRVRDVVDGLADAMRAIRKAQPAVWQWAPVTPSSVTTRAQTFADELELVSV